MEAESKELSKSSSTMEAEKPVMVFGIDDSENSYYALEWTLAHFFTPSTAAFKLFIIHVKPSPATAIGLASAGVIDVMPSIDSDLKKIAARVIEKAKEICAAKSVLNDVILEVVEGDARNILCEAVEQHHAFMLVLGSHGYGAIKRAVLGSVSDYCAHHAHCTVTIVKRPKINRNVTATGKWRPGVATDRPPCDTPPSPNPDPTGAKNWEGVGPTVATPVADGRSPEKDSKIKR